MTKKAVATKTRRAAAVSLNFMSCLEQSSDALREGNELASKVDRDQGCARRHKALARFRVGDDVIEGDAAGADLRQRRANANEIVVACGRVKARRQLGDGEADSRALDVGVAHAAGPNEVGSSDLAPHEIVRVIDHTHLIGLRVPHAKLDVVVRKDDGGRRCRRAGGWVGHARRIVGTIAFVKRAWQR